MESSGFVGYVKKVKNERGTLCSKFALVEFGLSELISFCKKWYLRDELCGLTKKKKLATVIVGLFSLKENAPTKKLVTVIVGLFSLEKRRLKTPTKNTIDPLLCQSKRNSKQARTDQVAPLSSFLNIQRKLFSNCSNFSVPTNIPRNTSKTRKPLFPRLETKNLLFEKIFFRKRLIEKKTELSARKTTFSQAEISYESRKVPFDQIKVSEKDALS